MSRFDSLKQKLSEGVLVTDGATGTMLYQKGVFINRCFEELNITNADIVKGLHSEYVDCGVDIIETNTFAANELKLAKYGLVDKLAEINASGVALAREAAGEDVLVAGAVGPSGVDTASHSSEASEKIAASFRSHIGALDAAGIDLLILETFSDVKELSIAIEVASEFEDLPVIAHLSVHSNGQTEIGFDASSALRTVSSYDNVVAAGFNCGIGPADMLDVVKMLKHNISKPLSVSPNAGIPRNVDGRSIYMSTPEYMAEYAKRFFEHGASIIGGCCGTTPEHIRSIVKAIHSLDKSQHSSAANIIIHEKESHEIEGFAPIALEEKSKLGYKLANSQEVLSIEISPPRGTDVSDVIEKAKICAAHGVDAINIPDGPRASSRLSPMITGLSIKQQANIEVVLHVCCRDKNVLGIQSDMLGAEVLGLSNVLLITGDPPKLGEFPDATAVFDLDAIALTALVSNLNRGIDIAGNLLKKPLGLTIAVGANPVANDIDREIERFKLKVQAGAEYCITQPVFELDSFYRFMDATSDCRIPTVAGIWPFASYKNAEFMANEVPGVVVPQKILDRMSKAKSKEDGRKIGVEIAREMVEALRGDVAGFTVSAPFGNVNTALAVMGKVDV